METKVAAPASVAGAFSKLIDYAGLFPPAKLALAEATAEYREGRRGPYAWMLGRFIIPVATLASSPQAGDGPFSAIVDGGPDSEKWLENTAALVGDVAAMKGTGVGIEALEVPAPAAFAYSGVLDATLMRLRELLASAKLGELPVYIEFARCEPWRRVVEQAMAAAAGAGLGAKLRCGGLTAEAFPTVDEVAEFIAAANAAGVPFKATAGLHHPVRRPDGASGFAMHGFLNLLAAAALAPRVDRQTLARIVAEEDAGAFRFEPASFHWRDERIDAAALVACRKTGFVSYGSCSFAEPIEDLVALRILAAQ